ncbi:cyclin-D-binding Myb-like transcription factor 1 isoform X1 [Argonauta hians]
MSTTNTDPDFDSVWLQQSSQIQSALPLAVPDQSIESGAGGGGSDGCDGVGGDRSEASLSDVGGGDGDLLKEGMKVLGGTDSGLNPGQQYLIVSRDTAASLGVSIFEEPGSKKLRLSGEDGQTYVLTITEPSPGSAVTEGKLSEAPGKCSPLDEPNSSSDPQAGKNDAIVTQAWFTTRTDKNALQNKGHSWVQGQWTKDEIELLQANINTYCKDNNIGNPTEIIFEMSKDERKDFYRTVAKGLNRPLFSVYRRVIRMYDQKNYVGKYSQDEMGKLRELRLKHGSDWAAIGAVLGRSASSVKDKCRLMKDTCNSGKWLPEEEQRLTDAVCELSGAQPGENITHGLSWAAVSERVGTRSEKQCRTKWLNYLNWKQQGGAEWTRLDDIDLILKVSSSQVTDETQIDWNELAKDWPSVRSPQWLRGKWWSLKRHVPDYHILPFSALVNYLKVTHLNVQLKNTPSSSSGSLQLTKVELPTALSLQLPPHHQHQHTTTTTTATTINTIKNNSHNTPDNQFSISVPLQTTEESLSGDVTSADAVQTYEVVHQLALTSDAFLIAQQQQQQNGSSVSLAESAVTSGGIIVHTLPVSQTSNNNNGGSVGNDSSAVSENVTVQINPHSTDMLAEEGTSSGVCLHTD